MEARYNYNTTTMLSRLLDKDFDDDYIQQDIHTVGYLMEEYPWQGHHRVLTKKDNGDG
jgi:hypothetical protein